MFKLGGVEVGLGRGLWLGGLFTGACLVPNFNLYEGRSFRGGRIFGLEGRLFEDRRLLNRASVIMYSHLFTTIISTVSLWHMVARSTL